MCERYVIPERAETERQLTPADAWWRFEPSFNVAPGRVVPVLRLHAGTSEGVMMRWGLVPAWAEGDVARASTALIERESVERSDLTRTAWLEGQRCLLPAQGFFLWELTPAGYRQPHFVRLARASLLTFAGVWDRSTAEDDDVLESCAVITAPADEGLRRLHPRALRVPVLVPPEERQAYLAGTPVQARALLDAAAERAWSSHPVSPRVNSLRYDDDQLVRSVA